jgi:hypothetical protein
MNFYVIAGGGGFVNPWMTKIIGLESLNRADILIDLGSNKTISLIAYDFDITNLIFAVPYAFDHNYSHALYIYEKLSTYDGTLLGVEGDIFHASHARDNLLHLIQFVHGGEKLHDLPYLEAVQFHSTHSTTASLEYVLDIVRYQIVGNPSNYYYNWPDAPILTRNIAFGGPINFTSVWSESWEHNTDVPSLRFKFTEADGYSNIDMIANNKLTVREYDTGGNFLHEYPITFPPTPPHSPPPQTQSYLTLCLRRIAINHHLFHDFLNIYPNVSQ